MLGGDDLVDGVPGVARTLQDARHDPAPDERARGDDVLAASGMKPGTP